jgi:hypothetical protein
MVCPANSSYSFRATALIFCGILPPLDHQNPVDMHTSIMCINILQNIKAVAPKLKEEIAVQTIYLYPDGRTIVGGVGAY